MGITSTYERLRQSYYWRGIKKDVTAYVKSCAQCQKASPPKKNLPNLMPVSPPTQVSTLVGTDLLKNQDLQHPRKRCTRSVQGLPLQVCSMPTNTRHARRHGGRRHLSSHVWVWLCPGSDSWPRWRVLQQSKQLSSLVFWLCRWTRNFAILQIWKREWYQLTIHRRMVLLSGKTRPSTKAYQHARRSKSVTGTFLLSAFCMPTRQCPREH